MLDIDLHHPVLRADEVSGGILWSVVNSQYNACHCFRSLNMDTKYVHDSQLQFKPLQFVVCFFAFAFSVFCSQIGVFFHLIKWEYKCSTKTRRHKKTGELVETRQWMLQNKRLFLSCLTMMQMSSRLSQTIQEKLRSPNHGFCWKTLLNILEK